MGLTDISGPAWGIHPFPHCPRRQVLLDVYLPVTEVPVQSSTLWAVSTTSSVLKMCAGCQSCEGSPGRGWLALLSSIRQQTMQHAYDLLTHISKLSLRVISEKSSLTLRQVTHIISIQLDSAVASVTHRHMTDITKLTYKMQAGQHVWFQLLPTENARPAGHCRSRGALGPAKTKEFSEMSHFQRWVIILHSGEWCLLP